MIYKYSQLTERISYEGVKIKDPTKRRKIPQHLGQFKLLFTEIMFLTKKSNKNNNNKVLYVGSAEGYHIAKLADLFPYLKFDLWDPGRFNIEKRPNIEIFNKFFTKKDAYSYKNEGDNILFICDIRTLKIAEYVKQQDNEKIDNIIDEDNQKQLEWVQIINPICAFLKFHPPYRPGKTKYFKGTIYLQPYSLIATEVRLLTNNYNDLTEYDNTEFDEKLAYFNFLIRSKFNIYKRWIKILEKYKIENSWDNNIALYIIDYYLRKIKKIKSDEEVGKLFMDILEFHKKEYGKKYNAIFTQV